MGECLSIIYEDLYIIFNNFKLDLVVIEKLFFYCMGNIILVV